jgi:biopolymer transport protein ExbD
MAALGNHEDDDVLASINIIPFVDIILVVLTIFMLTSTAIVKASIEVKLPRAASAGAAVSTTLNLVITRDGALHIDGAPRTLAEARSVVAAAAARQADTQAVISADRGVEYGRVIEVVDLVKQHGITSFALDVERAPVEP